MAKLTLLEITQDVLNDLDGDEVNSIDDTIESIQVAAIIRSTFLAAMSKRTWPHTRRLVQLTTSGDTDTPTHVTLPDNIKELCTVNYALVTNLAEQGNYRYRECKYLDPDNFLRVTNARSLNQGHTISVTDPDSLVPLLIVNNLGPTYFTSFDDKTLIFDAFDSAVDDTLQTNKFQVIAYTNPVWVHEDSAIPDLPEDAFPGLVEESKSRASIKLRQQVDQASAAEAQSQKRYMARKDWVVAGGIKFPNYGRQGKGRTGLRRDPTFRRDNT